MPSATQSIIDVMIQHAQNRPDKKAYIFRPRLIDPEQSLTFAELDAKARNLAVNLQQRGVSPCARVLLMLAPGIDLICALFGCFYAGAIAVPVYPPVNSKLIEKNKRIIKLASPSLTLTTLAYIDKYPIETSFLAIEEIKNGQASDWQMPQLDETSLAFLQYTSGSTAYPKGVMVSHANVLDNVEKIYNAFAMHDNSILCGWLPPYHDMGLTGNILSPAYGGLTSIMMTPFSFLQNPVSWLQMISQYQASISGAPNFAYDYCVRRIKEERKEDLDLSGWQVAFNGAEPVHADTMERFYQAFKQYGFRREALFPCYGLAEATLLVSSNQPGKLYNTVNIAREHYSDHRVHFVEEPAIQLVSSGKMHQKVKIVDPDTLLECDKDQVGEIWIQSGSVAHGYWQQEEESNHAFQPDSWLRSGDLGFIHEDELYISGRIKDLLILYGKNHYPQDIEYTLAHAPFHDKLGSSAAFIQAHEGDYRLTILCEIKTTKVAEDSYADLFNALFELIYEEHQLEVHVIGLVQNKSLPKTTSGKISRNFCRKQFEQHTLPILATWSLSDRENYQ